MDLACEHLMVFIIHDVRRYGFSSCQISELFLLSLLTTSTASRESTLGHSARSLHMEDKKRRCSIKQ
nr:hypothetical transcript [Hymenolepis microstoma]